MKVLVTGGAGFIGSNFIRRLLARDPAVQVVNLDKLTYAGNPDNIKEFESNPRVRFIRGDVADPRSVAQAISGCEAVVHFAAETHVDRSIVSASDFLATNVVGTHCLLEAARAAGVKRYIQISTDEVYGSLESGAADEEAPLRPNSPYAASKAGADHLVRAYQVTYGLPALIVRGCNNFGPHQFPEKFIPLMITHAIEGESLPIYGDGRYVREWIFVSDFCDGIGLLLERGRPGEIYNIGSGEYRVNLELAKGLLALLGKPPTLIRHVTDRLGHDRRYAIESKKIRALGWKPRASFEQALETTVRWYQAHESWWRPLRAGFKT
ncbi:MAG: dTDP-glucose 4,6-dehydratase [Candidatus Omnitrophica bacterium]|nr:dTDP-glucose 4,6-dehydratase [Candidatus Omnitrophota bacterium]